MKLVISVCSGLTKVCFEEHDGSQAILFFVKPVNFIFLPDTFVDRLHHDSVYCPGWCFCLFIQYGNMHNYPRPESAHGIRFYKRFHVDDGLFVISANELGIINIEGMKGLASWVGVKKKRATRFRGALLSESSVQYIPCWEMIYKIV